MSWVTVIWSMTAGICLTLGTLHFLIWTHQRNHLAHLAFAFSAIAAACYAVLEMTALRVQTPSEYGELLRWILFLGLIEGVAIAWFIRLYLHAGRLWLLWLICALRAVMLVLNFVSGPNFYYSEITSLQPMPLLGEFVAHPHGVLHPWAILMQLSIVLIIIFAIDAAHTASKQGGRRRAWVLGGLMAVGFSLALVSYALYVKEILPSTLSSQWFLLLVLLMSYELSRDVINSARIAGELRESEQRFALAADAANLGIWVRDLTNDKFWATDHWRELLRFTRSERIDFDSLLMKIHPEDRESVRQTLTSALAGGGRYETEYRVLLPENQVRWIASRGRVEFNVDGKPVLMRGVSVDVTTRKNAEDALAQHRNELSHLSRVTTLSELSGSLAHELNQPLAIILTNAQAAQRLLAQEPPDISETRDILADIVSEDQRAGEIIRRLRALLKPGQIQKLRLSVNEIIEDVLRIARSDLIDRGVTVHTTLAKNAPHILGDRIQLQQVLLNLILNACDAMVENPPGERQLCIGTRQQDGQVRITVSDLGSGLPLDPEQIFRPFYTTKKEGLGLGLPICRTIASAHNGRLWAESNTAEGSSLATCGATLILEIPVAEELR